MNYLDLNTYSTSGLEFRDVAIKPINEKYSINHSGLIYNKLDGVYINTSLCGIPKYHYFSATYTPRDGKQYRKTLRVHRVIAMTFIGECPVDGHVVDHIDRDRYNNHYTNLRWISRCDNIRNSDRGDLVSKDIPVDNEVRWDVKYKGVSSKRSKSGSYIVTCNKDIIGYANNDEFAAKMYDTAARMTYKDPYLNFPYVCLDESTIFNTHRRGIKRSLFVYINKRSISNTILLKIQYRYKHEYLNKCDIVRQYSISLYTVNKILEGVDSKVDKKSLFSKKLMRQTNRDIEIIRWKYLALELYNDKSNNYTKKQIAGIVGEPIRVVVKYLPTRCSQQNSLDKKLIPKVLEMYSTGEYTQVELAKIFNTTRSIIGNIIHGRVVV